MQRSGTGRVSRLTGYTYPATYKVCRGSASCGRPNPLTGLHRLAPHRCRASARLAWFPDGYRISIFPYRSALRPNHASRALPASILGLPDSGGGTTGSRRADAPRHYGLRRRISPPWQEGNHARKYSSAHLSCRARSVTTRRTCGRNREVSSQPVSRFLPPGRRLAP